MAEQRLPMAMRWLSVMIGPDGTIRSTHNLQNPLRRPLTLRQAEQMIFSNT